MAFLRILYIVFILSLRIAHATDAEHQIDDQRGQDGLDAQSDAHQDAERSNRPDQDGRGEVDDVFLSLLLEVL